MKVISLVEPNQSHQTLQQVPFDKRGPIGVNTRLVDWVVDLLLEDIRKLTFFREGSNVNSSNKPVVYQVPKGKTCIDEARGVIEMPKFNEKAAAKTGNHRAVEVSTEVVASSLREYVTIIASMYRNNPLHNFEQ